MELLNSDAYTETFVDKENGMSQDTEEFLVEKTIIINAGIEDVWSALTSPAAMEKWLNVTGASTSWRIGSPITFSTILEGTHYHFHGTVLNYDEERRRLQYSYWSKLSRLPDLPENHAIVTMALEEKGQQTILLVKQERFSGEDDYRHANFHWEMTTRAFKKFVEGERAEKKLSQGAGDGNRI